MLTFPTYQECNLSTAYAAPLSIDACMQVVQEVNLSISPEDLKDLKAAMQNKPRGAVQDPGLIAVRS